MILVFSGYNQRAIIAFLRTLKKHNVPFGIVARDAGDSIFLTSYKDRVIFVRKRKALALEEVLFAVRSAKKASLSDIILIAPSTEFLNRFLLKNRPVLEKEGCIIPLVEESLYTRISDKYAFCTLCQSHGIEIPQEYPEIITPCVAKPRVYATNTGDVFSPVLIKDKRDRDAFIKCYRNRIEDFFFQEYVVGESFYLLYYFGQGGVVMGKLSQENILQQPEGKSIIAAESASIHNEDVSASFEKLFQGFNFRGLVMVEVRRTSDGRDVMIEANPRFWGPSQLFVDSGVDLFALFLKDFGLVNSLPKSKNTPTLYFWFGGLVEVLTQGRTPVFYGRKKEYFLQNMHTFLQHDIYKRSDTLPLFAQECHV